MALYRHMLAGLARLSDDQVCAPRPLCRDGRQIAMLVMCLTARKPVIPSGHMCGRLRLPAMAGHP